MQSILTVRTRDIYINTVVPLQRCDYFDTSNCFFPHNVMDEAKEYTGDREALASSGLQGECCFKILTGILSCFKTICGRI